MRRCNKVEVYAGGMPFVQSRARPLAYVTLFWIAWCAVACGRLEAVSTQQKTVLVLYGDRLSIPALKSTEQGLMAALSRRQPEAVDIFSEYLDLVRFPAAQYGDDRRALSAGKIRGAKARCSDRGREFALELAARTPR